MGEREQGGMLRTVIVLGLIAIISFAVIAGILVLKSTSSENTDKGVGVITAKTFKQYHFDRDGWVYPAYDPVWNDKDNATWGAKYAWFPTIADVPAHSWREVHFTISATEDIYARVDINASFETMDTAHGDNNKDAISDRWLAVYDMSGKQLLATNSLATPSAENTMWMKKNTSYLFVVKWHNTADEPLVERAEATNALIVYRNSKLLTGTADGRGYSLKVKSFEANTYPDRYAQYSLYN